MERLRFTLILIASVIVFSLQTITVQARYIGPWVPLYQGIEYATGNDSNPRLMQAFALRIDLRNPAVQMYASHDNGAAAYEVALQTTPAFLAEHGCKVAVNSSYFNASLSPNTNIEGLLVSNGAVVSTWQAARDAEIRFTFDKIASIVNNGGTGGVYTGCAGDAYFLINGVPGGDNGAAEPRTTAGLSQDGKYLILVCVDGRQAGWSMGATILDMSYWLLDFGAYNGMNFDGGGSTTMSIAGWGSYVNRPCYGYARSVGASLGVESSDIINPPFLFDDTNYWFAGGSASTIWATGPGSWYGSIVTDQTGNDCNIFSGTTYFAGVWGPEVINVSVFPQNGNTANHDMQLFWKTISENWWDAPKSTPVVNYTAQNNWQSVNLTVNSDKWWGQAINQLRLDFDNTNHGNRWIVNHVIKQPAFWWHFASDTMGWYAGNSLSPTWQCGDWGWPGVLVTDQTGDDAFMMSPATGPEWPFHYLGGSNDRIHVRVWPQNGNTVNHDMSIYWTTEAMGWTESQSTHVNYSGKDQWCDVYLPVGQNSNWATQHITQIRVDFDGVNHGNRWIVDYVASEY